MFGRKKKEEIKTLTSVGGIPFFITLGCLLILSLVNTLALLPLIDGAALLRWRYFAAGGVLGAWMGHVLIRHELSIFLHELKHAIISNLAGNRDRGMKIRRRSGHFQYEYYQHTEKYNALIALAPYFLPLFTLPSLLFLLVPGWGSHPTLPLVVIGFACGADLILNLRDISGKQSDIVNIKGGFTVGLLFIGAMNIVLLSYLFAWACQGWQGLQFMLTALTKVVVSLVAYYWQKKSLLIAP